MKSTAPSSRAPGIEPAASTTNESRSGAGGGLGAEVALPSFDTSGSPLAVAQRRFVDSINSSPRCTAQRRQLEKLVGAPPDRSRMVAQKAAASKPNRTGLPDPLKSGVESLSGLSMDHVRVHFNSTRPAQLNALAYAQGADIHVGPGQERHLPHEAWHVVQQAQGRVRATTQLTAGIGVNDDASLEREADVFGARAAQAGKAVAQRCAYRSSTEEPGIVQRALATDADILGQRGANYNWTTFRGARAEEAGGGASEAGRSASLTAGGAMTTSVRWGPLDGVAREGTTMVARVGPDHNLGSTPSAAASVARVRAFATLSGKDYISGHLMNEKLGGPGTDSRNLTAISGSANGLQSANIERYVRDPVNTTGAWMYYRIDVTYTDASGTTDATDARLPKVAALDAPGIKLTPIAGAKYQVDVRYASRLTASWYPLDHTGGQAAPATNVGITIASPLAALGGEAASVALAPSGAASGVAAARTEIRAEELVLTKSDLLKHIVDSREPLALRIKQLKDNIEALQGDMDTARAAYAELAAQAAAVGREAGAHYGYAATLAGRGLGAALPEPEGIDDDAYRNAYREGLVVGREAGQSYIQGYDDGGNQGWSDDLKNYASADVRYREGYDRGYAEGLASGDYSAGKRYVFEGVAVLPRIHEYNQNVFRHLRGSIFLELTGECFPQPNGLKWYEVRLVGAADPDLADERGTVIGWMKRKWLNKGV